MIIIIIILTIIIIIMIITSIIIIIIIIMCVYIYIHKSACQSLNGVRTCSFPISISSLPPFNSSNIIKHHEPSGSPRDHASIAQDGGEGGISGFDLLHILQQMLHLSYDSFHVWISLLIWINDD